MKRHCNQCNSDMKMKFLVENSDSVGHEWVYVCTNIKCPNAGLLCISQEELYKVTKNN